MRSVVADVGLWRLQVIPISCGFDALGINRHGVTHTKAADTRLGEQPLNGGLRPLVLALTEVMLANASARINEVEGWPVPIPESTPDCVSPKGRTAIRRAGIVIGL